jgi:Spy/CpxP family protein refolding chaperone
MLLKKKGFLFMGLLLTLALAAICAGAAQYQGGGPGGPGGRRGPMSPDDRLKQMTKDFDLTADQQAKIKPILVDQQKQMDDLRNNSSGDRQSMRGQMMKIQQDTNTQIRALLDDKQKDKFDQMEKDRQARMQNRRGGPGGPGGPGGDNQGGPPPQN